MNLRGVVVSLGLFSALGAGCVIDIVRGPYESCPNGESCSAGTVCLPASFTLNGGTGAICSVNCTSGGQCPQSIYGSVYAPTCVVSASTGQGLCYDTCVGNVDCGIGTRCAQIPGTLNRICVPLGGASSCGTAGLACCGGGACAAGLSCVSNVCTTAPACGGAGQACCATGSACVTGLVCNSGVCGGAVPTRQAYQKCDTAAGDVCGGGTSCIPSIAQVQGKSRGSACTLGCPSGAATSCPGYVAGAPRQAVECVNFTGNLTEAQCFRLCESQNDCTAFNTTCTAYMMPTGQIRVCVPVGPRGG
jgi:hypothetical protein